MYTKYVLLSLACLAPSVVLGKSAPFGALGAVVSNGTAGALSSYFGADPTEITLFDTDTGQIFSGAGGGNSVFTTIPFTTIQPSVGGLPINVFNFTTFDDGGNANFTIFGSKPAIIAATGNITINGNLKVTSGGGAGGMSGFANYPQNQQNDGFSGGGIGGGEGGVGPGIIFGGAFGGYTGGSGGGGGSVSPGQGGSKGTIQFGQQPGTFGFFEPGGLGGSAQDATLLQGGGGGGGSPGGFFPGEEDNGVSGGAGGGALFFTTPLSMSVTGSLTANGGNGAVSNVDGGSSGGGAGGELWFDVGQTFDNEGFISALGGNGGNPFNTGDQFGTEVGGIGSGGEIIIDPISIINNGILNVSDGSNGSAFGGNIELLGDSVTGSGQILGVVPEPTSAVLLAAPLLGGLLKRRRR